MSKIATALFAISLLLVGSIYADISLKPTPIQTLLKNQLYSGNSSDEFGGWGGEKKDDKAENVVLEPRKSALKAGALSALLPGAGQYYVGSRSKAKLFFVAEAITVISYVAFESYSNWKEEDFVDFAAVHANAQLQNRDKEFRDMVAFYDNIREYNIEARIIESERPYYFDTPENHWDWDSKSSRETFRALKNSSRSARRRAEFMIGIAIVNRIISVVDAVRDASRLNRRIGFRGSQSVPDKYKLAVSPFSSINQVRLSFFTDW